MKGWMEVSSEYRFKKKMNGEIGLFAPESTRYINMMKDVEPGDIILHYLIKQGASKEHASSIIGISKAKSKMKYMEPRIHIDLEEIYQFPNPIKKNEFLDIKDKSLELNKLIRMSFLKYLTELSESDLFKIVSINEENLSFVKDIKAFSSFFKRL